MTVTYSGGSINTTGASAQATVTVPIPSTASVGDLFIVWCASQNNATFTADQGFVADLNVAGTSICIGTLKKVLVAGDPGKTVTITSSSSAKRLTAGIVGVSGGTVVDVSGTASGSGVAVSSPGETPTQVHDFVLTIAAIQSAATRNWSPWSLGGTAASAGPFGGNGASGSGGVETAAFYLNDYNSVSATGALVSTATGGTTNNAAITYTIKNAGGGSGTYPVKINKGSGWVVKPVKVNLGAGWVTKVVRNQSGAPPTNPNTILIGSSYQSNGLQGWLDMDSALGAAAGLTGRVMSIKHNYDNNIPADFAHGACAPNPGINVHSISNIKSESGDPGGMAAGHFDTALTNYVQSCPANWTTYLCWQSEPESLNPVNYRQGFARFAKIVVATRGTLPVIPTIILQSGTGRGVTGVFSDWDPVTELTSNSVAAGHPTYGPLSLGEVVFAQDGYDLSNGGAGHTPSFVFGPGQTLIAASGYTRFGISEVASDNSGEFYTLTIARQFATDLVTYIKGIAGMEFGVWFASTVGTNAPSKFSDSAGRIGWRMVDTTIQTTWANFARNQGQ